MAVAPPPLEAGVPEVGNVVRVRDRTWVISDMARSQLPPDVFAAANGAQHMVELTSVEDDGYGDQLRVTRCESSPRRGLHWRDCFPFPIQSSGCVHSKLKTALQ